MGNFLHRDRQVLRFVCDWDGGGERAEARRFKLHYFLVDGTIEVLEDTKNLTGRDPFPVLLKVQSGKQCNIIIRASANLCRM